MKQPFLPFWQKAINRNFLHCSSFWQFLCEPQIGLDFSKHCGAPTISVLSKMRIGWHALKIFKLREHKVSFRDDATVCYLNVINFWSLYGLYVFSYQQFGGVLNYEPQILWHFSLREVWSQPIHLTMIWLMNTLNSRVWRKLYFWSKRPCSFCLAIFALGEHSCYLRCLMALKQEHWNSLGLLL